MKIAVFDTHRYDRRFIEEANADYGHQLTFFEPRLNEQTAELAKGFDAVCPFVNDTLDAPTLHILHNLGVKLIALRAAGYNKIDLVVAKQLGIKVARVPAYSPHAVAEHAFALLLTLVRKIHRAYNRVRENNFSLDGLQGFDLYGKTFGIIGAGRIGQIAAHIANGFGCNVLVYNLHEDPALAKTFNFTYVAMDELLAQSDIISLHLPLTPQTEHLMNAETFAKMNKHPIILNTSRGALIDSVALLEALKSGQVGGVGLDVYELEEGVFFENHSEHLLQDDTLARLLTFPNVLITSHQGFLTNEALRNIADTTLNNARQFEAGEPLINEISV